jgi:alkanesulfonate monooxygenase SsuD/methylene tetrahydromethanopterin reductase-like flavin-dependent oxidoreductase (luciferase family)
VVEPITTVAALAAETSRIGLIATASTSFTEPFNLARCFASIDHLSGGRTGWNIVTSFVGEENFGRALLGHDDRYRQAAEYADLVTKLWDSWDDELSELIDFGTGAARLRANMKLVDGLDLDERIPEHLLPNPSTVQGFAAGTRYCTSLPPRRVTSQGS